MEIRQLERTYHDFFVPTFVVTVGGQDVHRDLFLAVTDVTVDLKEQAAGRFSFTVSNVFDWETREFAAKRDERRIDILDLFAFGSPVEIALGYGDPAEVKRRPLLTGIVTELVPAFDEGSDPQLVVSGFDGLYPLTVGRATRSWEQRRDSDAVVAVARARGVSTNVEKTSPEKGRIDQNQETDLAFIARMAKRNGVTFYMRNGTMYFGPRQNSSSDVVELAWGQGLVTFRPEASLAKQIGEVQVHGWSAAKGEPILGRARRGEETGRDTRAKSGGDRVAAAVSHSEVLSVRAAVRTQAEADARARGILEERAQVFVTGSGESMGIPDIVPDVNLAFSGLGRGFSKTYYVSAATHTIDEGGYRTSFEVQETTV